jgi:hypothetical protein
MNLRTQLKNTKMQKGEMIQEYFSRISEIKEQLKAIGDTIDEDEFVITALMVLQDLGIPSSSQFVAERRNYSVKAYGKNAPKKRQG